jgi:hypothetical protein
MHSLGSVNVLHNGLPHRDAVSQLGGSNRPKHNAGVDGGQLPTTSSSSNSSSSRLLPSHHVAAVTGLCCRPVLAAGTGTSQSRNQLCSAYASSQATMSHNKSTTTHTSVMVLLLLGWRISEGRLAHHCSLASCPVPSQKMRAMLCPERHQTTWLRMCHMNLHLWLLRTSHRELTVPLSSCHLISQALTLPLAVGVAVEGHAAVQGPVSLCGTIAIHRQAVHRQAVHRQAVQHHG